MTLENENEIERIMKKDKRTMFLLVEHRKWDEIKNADTKLWNKIENAKAYAESDEAVKKFGKSVTVVLACKYRPPQNILRMLKATGTKLKIVK